MIKLNKKGFTLVELLAVIVILALLMVVATRTIGNIMNDSKDKAAQTEAQKILSKTYEDFQTFNADSSVITKYTYAPGTAITSGEATITLKDANFNIIIKKDTTNVFKSICIDDGKGTNATKYKGNVENGNSVGSLTKGTGACTSTDV